MSKWPETATEEQVAIAEEIVRRVENLEGIARELYEALRRIERGVPSFRAVARDAMARYEREVGE